MEKSNRGNAADLSPIVLWGEGGKKIDFVSQGFDPRELEQKLGLEKFCLSKTFGIADEGEIKRRQRNLKFMIENPRLREFVRRVKTSGVYLPIFQQAFLDYFNPKSRKNKGGRNFLWRLLSRLSGLIQECEAVSPEIQQFQAGVSSLEHLELTEQAMAADLAREIQKATYLEGTLRVLVHEDGFYKAEVVSSEAFGFKKHSFRLTDKWGLTPNGSEKPGRIKSLVIRLCNYLDRKLRYSPLILTETPSSIIEAVEKYLQKKFFLKDLVSPEWGHKVCLVLEYLYDQDGLRFHLLGVEVSGSSNKVRRDNWSYADFPGYSPRQLDKLSKDRRQRWESLLSIPGQIYAHKLLAVIEEKLPGFVGDWVLVESPKADTELKWFSMEYLTQKDPRFKDIYREISSFRAWVADSIGALKVVAELAQKLLDLQAKWGLPMTFPEILPNGHHLVAFNKLFPIHLIGQARKDLDPDLRDKISHGMPCPVIGPEGLTPITSLPPLNGDMIGFTGQNAGGKSTALQAIVEAIYQAQSGLPVFGEGFQLNVKEVLGAVFIERGEGSTCQLMLEKHMDMLRALAACHSSRIVLLLDEVGTGTQEQGGLQYGMKLLHKLSGSGCSVVYSTQIPDLARFSEQELGAKCYQFTLNHGIQPGVGLGGIEQLMAEMGIDKMLE